MGRDLQKIVLCDTINHPTPILLEWSYGLADLGYDTKYLPVPNHSILEIDEEVDLLVYAGINDSLIEDFETFKKRQPNVKIIGAADHWKDCYTKLKGIVDFFLGAFESIPHVTKQYNDNGFRYYNVPLAANHRLFYKMDVPKIYDACFIGNLSHGYRGEDIFLYPILDNYRCYLGGITYKNYTNGFTPYQEHNLIRNQTAINLNFHVPYQKPGMGNPIDRVDCNQSVFNIALSGNFQMCDHPLVLEYFKGNVILGNEDNWKELFDYYLNNPVEREEKAYQTMLIAQKDHTWVARMTQFINLLNKHYND